MSRGLGIMEREIIRAMNHCANGPMHMRLVRMRALYGFVVEPGPFDIVNMQMGGGRTSENSYSSFKRALRSLQRKGLIKKYSGARAAGVELCVPVEEVHIDLTKEEEPGQRKAEVVA